MIITEATVQGNEYELTVEFFNRAGVLTSPNTVTCAVIGPDGKERPVTATETAPGKFRGFYLPLLPGEWQYRFAGTGGVNAANEGTFWVKNTNFAT